MGAGWAESADAEAEKAKGALDEFFAAEKRAGDGVDFFFGFKGVFDAHLTGEGFEIAVADFHLHGAGCEVFLVEFMGDIGGLLHQQGNEDFSILGIPLESLLDAHAFDSAIEFQRSVVFPECE